MEVEYTSSNGDAKVANGLPLFRMSGDLGRCTLGPADLVMQWWCVVS